jgi:hypothetical protein
MQFHPSSFGSFRVFLVMGMRWNAPKRSQDTCALLVEYDKMEGNDMVAPEVILSNTCVSNSQCQIVWTTHVLLTNLIAGLPMRIT